MQARIRRKVLLIQQFDARIEDNLSELDLELHKMSSGYHMLHDEVNYLDAAYPRTGNYYSECSSGGNNVHNVDSGIRNTTNEELQNENANCETDSSRVLVVQSSQELEEPIIEDAYSDDPPDETIDVGQRNTNESSDVSGIGPRNEGDNEHEKERDKTLRNLTNQSMTSNLSVNSSKRAVNVSKTLQTANRTVTTNKTIQTAKVSMRCLRWLL